jgi:hypothetical protein
MPCRTVAVGFGEKLNRLFRAAVTRDRPARVGRNEKIAGAQIDNNRAALARIDGFNAKLVLTLFKRRRGIDLPARLKRVRIEPALPTQ